MCYDAYVVEVNYVFRRGTRMNGKTIIKALIIVLAALIGICMYQHNQAKSMELKYSQQIEQMDGELSDLHVTLAETNRLLQEQQSKNEELNAQLEDLQEQQSRMPSAIMSARANEVSRGSGRSTTLEITGYSADGGDPYCGGAVMANGEPVHVGAAALNGVPFGTRIYVPFLDTVVVVKDRCGSDGVLDIYCDTTTECYQIGRRVEEVVFLD